VSVPLRHPGGFPVVGIIGGGQLARMCAAPAAELGLTLSVLAEAEDAAAALVVPSSPVGRHTEIDDVLAFARHCDVVTFDHEHVPDDVLAALVASGVPLHPSPQALTYAQDKGLMRARLAEIGIPCPLWRLTRGSSVAEVTAEVAAFAERAGWPVVVKTPRGGYDGKGVLVAGSLADVARSPSGQAAAWPVVETVQTDGICTEVLAPAPGLDPDLATGIGEAALRIARDLDVTGVFAVELFELPGGAFVVNELAMRPHNSGHWSMDGAVTGQFEQHLRAVLDLPLGSPAALAPWTVMANILGGADVELYSSYRHVMARDPGAKLHLYGKDVRPGRKIGHVNVLGADLDGLRTRARHAADYIEGAIRE
jgi:5-(carboxyamino)imidazole ribonucleotide synthase